MKETGSNLLGYFRAVVLGMLLAFLVLPSVFPAVKAADSPDPNEIEEKQSEAAKTEERLERERAAKAKLEQNLTQIQSSIYVTQKEINKTEGLLDETKKSIAWKEQEIARIDKRISFQKDILKSLLREVYYRRQESQLELLTDKKLSDLLGFNESLEAVNDRIGTLMADIEDDKDKLASEKSSLEEDKEDHEKLLALKSDQQEALVSDRKEVQADVAEKEATIGQLQEKLAKIRSDLSSLLGKAYDTDDIMEAAGFASKASGVRKDFILGMLVVESDLGRFTGGCYAKDSRMSGTRLELFKDICEELDYDWKKRKVSCPPKSYKGTGGAMGVAQFMSDTWMGYKSSIAANTGHNPPDPWSLTDGVMAMALKLARGGATKKSGECNAAKLYLSGTTASKYNWYCQRVLYWADNYEKKL